MNLAELTWPDVDALSRDTPVIFPIAALEQHGRHMPVFTDSLLMGEIARRTETALGARALFAPLQWLGNSHHHMDFPGTIDIHSDHLLNFVLDVTRSVAHHGFERILIADGHGSNMPILDMVARRTILETKAMCGCFIWPSLAAETINRVRESSTPGGMAHACELETSVYLYLDSQRVQME